MTWPLLRPALADAFLLGFVESLADFGNPIVLAGNFEVLSTKIFFAIAGAQYDPGRAAVLASRAARAHAGRVLPAAALARTRFVRHRQRQGRRRHRRRRCRAACGSPATGSRRPGSCSRSSATRSSLTGGFVKDIGRGDMTLSLAHFRIGLQRRMGQVRMFVERLGVGQPVHDDRGRRRSRRRSPRWSACCPRTSSRAIASPDARRSSS